jgi:hypothetical protein
VRQPYSASLYHQILMATPKRMYPVTSLTTIWGFPTEGRHVRADRATREQLLFACFHQNHSHKVTEDIMNIWTILFVVLLVAWLGGFTVFHVAGGLIHLLLVFAVISLILHFVMGARTV